MTAFCTKCQCANFVIHTTCGTMVLRRASAGCSQASALQLEAHRHHIVGEGAPFSIPFSGGHMQAQQQFTIVLPFRVTPSQRDLLRQLAAQRGTTVSELIRAAVLPNTNTVNAQRDGAALPAK